MKKYKVFEIGENYYVVRIGQQNPYGIVIWDKVWGKEKEPEILETHGYDRKSPKHDLNYKNKKGNTITVSDCCGEVVATTNYRYAALMTSSHEETELLKSELNHN